MNLIKCNNCNKNRVCRYYDKDDPRSIEGVCRQFFDYENKRTETKIQPQQQVKNTEPKLEIASVKDKQQVYVGRKMYRVYQHPNAGWVTRVTTVQKNTQFEMQTDLGVKVFYTQAEAQAKAYELNHDNK